MKRLYLQIYAAFLAVTLLWVVVTAIAVRATFDDDSPRHVRRMVERVGADLPAPGGSSRELQRELADLARQMEVRLTLWSEDRELLASSGPPLPPPVGDRPAYWFHADGPGLMVHLEDGRWLALATDGHVPGGRLARFLLVLALLAVLMALGAYPIARRITGRLEALQEGVESLGAGDLSARVPVQGSDEVAELARRFNVAADRIEALVQGQRRVLASASHELRSPLARLRMAIELLDGDDPQRAALVEGAIGDVAELDELIEDLLLASRLEARPIVPEPVDLGAILAEEAGRAGARAEGAAMVRGDARALRRLVRNLLENAVRHGGTDVAATVTAGPPARLVVEDRGPGVAEGERERIFEPFYRPAGHREGTHGGVGLGLALVRQIAERHGGRAWYEPREGGGSRFVVEIGSG